ncbi:MAG TPA: alkaline phosphatase PhoX [Gallionella sp.]|nr:alkaline phosphatase PhoX [Gallionella sp.]
MFSKNRIAALVGSALALMAMSAQAGSQGSSSSQPPYVNAIASGIEITSILTTGDSAGGYTMAGIPDGLGAYDNGDGTFTVLMNHEIYADAAGPVGIVRAHGGKGAFVSEWVIDKHTLAVKSGADLMKHVHQLDVATGAWVPVPATGALGQTSSFARFCSADLADRRAFYNKATRKGTRQRIFLNGEESGPTYQRGLAHVATGPNKGHSYVLPWAANANGAWENLLANPYSGDRTVVVGTADGGSNGLYVYVGTKTDTGNDIEKAGLIGGAVYRVAVFGNLPEMRTADAGLGLAVNANGNYEGSFALVAGADPLNTVSTKFLRPEDGAWDKKNHNRFFFVTTDQMDAAKDGNLNSDIKAGQVGRTRLWALNFTDSSRPELGGTIEMLLDGTSAKGDYQMFDNITVSEDGTLILLEDAGNNQHNGKMWKFNPADGSMVKLAGFDPALFGDIGLTGSITKDEETSGVIDITDILDRDDAKTYHLFVAQNHAPSGNPETVEGGQLMLMAQPAPQHDDGDGHSDGRKK